MKIFTVWAEDTRKQPIAQPILGKADERMNSDAQTNFLSKQILEIVPQTLFWRTVITAAGNYFSAKSRKKKMLQLYFINFFCNVELRYISCD